jgi:polyketide cyclase/dehydrase/lipid transport protein
MGHVEESVVVNGATPQEVWDYSVNSRNWPDYIAGEIRDVQGDPEQVGGSWTVVAKILVVETVTRFERTFSDPPKLTRMKVSGDATGEFGTSYEPVAGGTKVSQWLDYTPRKGLFGPLADLVTQNAVKNTIKKNIEAVKRNMEAGKR